jgi:phosphatidylinositol alpha-1,6-mannosyltransferase
VDRCIVRVLEAEREAGRIDRFDVLSLADTTAGAGDSGGVRRYARGSQSRFIGLLWRLVLQRRPDLVLVDHAGLARAMRLPLPGLTAPYALFAHGTEMDAFHSGWRRAAVEGAATVLTNSAFTAARVSERFPSVAARVRPVLLCIDPERIALWEAESSGPPVREPSVLIVGRMWSSERGKGHDALLAAMPRVRERVPAAELWIVGSGDDRPRLERVARERGLGDSARFLGGISDRELGERYRRASALAMPSRQEGFGVVYAEALWHGLPCIGSTADAAGEVIDDGHTGLLVPYDAPEPLGAAILRLLTAREETERMGRAAAAEARRRFTFPRFRHDLLRALGLLPSA